MWKDTCLFFSIDMYTEGVMDLDEMVLYQPYLPKEEKEGNLAKIKDKSRNRYFPAYEKVSASCLTFRAFRGSIRPQGTSEQLT